jgi:hypothetical protein
MLPFAVRDPACRGSKAKGIPDQWGAPSDDGYFRDDNSLVKSLPRSLMISNSSNALVDGRYVGTSFVASHVWRLLAGGGPASRNVLTYSFAPNLVWLPTQVSKLTDREGSFVQSYLQALSIRIYRDVALTPKLTRIVQPIWDTLELRPEAADFPLPVPSALNYFQTTPDWIDRRSRTLALVLAGLEDIGETGKPRNKVISTRYTSGLSGISEPRRKSLVSWLRKYQEALREAALSPCSGG